MASRVSQRPKRPSLTKAHRAVTPSGTSPETTLPSADFVNYFIDRAGFVDLDRVADAFRMTKSEVAETVGLRAAAVSSVEQCSAPRTQRRIRELLEILSPVRERAGGEVQAMAWYRAQPIHALDGRTPEALVKAGQAGAVRHYLDHLSLGGFA